MCAFELLNWVLTRLIGSSTFIVFTFAQFQVLCYWYNNCLGSGFVTFQFPVFGQAFLVLDAPCHILLLGCFLSFNIVSKTRLPVVESVLFLLLFSICAVLYRYQCMYSFIDPGLRSCDSLSLAFKSLNTMLSAYWMCRQFRSF